jgi:hypothetical protein
MLSYFKTISEYWELVNPAGVILEGFITAIITLTVVLTIMLLLRKFILIKRSNTFLKWISRAYFILIPLLVGFFGFKYGLVNGVQHQVSERIAPYAKILDTAYVPKFQDMLDEVMLPDGTVKKGCSPMDYINGLSERVYVMYTTALTESAKGSDGKISSVMSNVLLTSLKSKHIASAVKYVIKKIIVKVTHADDAAVDLAMLQDLQKLFKEGIFTKIINAQIPGDKIGKLERGCRWYKGMFPQTYEISAYPTGDTCFFKEMQYSADIAIGYLGEEDIPIKTILFLSATGSKVRNYVEN